MPKNKSRRGEANGNEDTERTDENDSGANGSSNRVGASRVGEGEDVHDEAERNVSGKRSRRDKSISLSQPIHNHGLGPWTEAVTETVRSMGVAHKAIKNLQDRFVLHVDDLTKMEQTAESLTQLREECRQKDKELERQLYMITTLSKMNSKNEEEIERKMKKIEKEKQELDHERSKSEKRIAMAMAEERLKLKNELEKLVTEQGQSHDKRKKELEDEFTKLRDENNKQVTALKADNDTLLKTMEEQKMTTKIQAKELERTVEQCDVLERAKDSVKKEKLALEKELDMIKTEFALSSNSKEYFMRGFADIYNVIEEISLKYFNGIDGRDLENMHEDLVAADHHFESVPIDDSEDSYKLRAAHAQRIISEATCEYIWKPFHSEITLSRPDFNDLLARISDELERSSRGGHAANVWTALTMRALQSLPADLVLSRVPESKDLQRPLGSLRAEAVISKVFTHLSPLVSSTQYEELRIELVKLAHSAIDIWNDAQSGGFKFTVHPVLDIAHREDWRSQTFDPAPLSIDHDDNTILSHTHPRIFMLFPRVVARAAADSNKEVGPPGSWPPDSDLAPQTVEMCIHHGIGLPESSSLVRRGKEEQEETKEYLSKVLENAKKEIHSSRRLNVRGERNSMESSTSAPSSPSQQWKRGNVMRVTEK